MLVVVEKRIDADSSPSTIDERTETPFVYVEPCEKLSERGKRAIRSKHSDSNACFGRIQWYDLKIHQSFRFCFESRTYTV